MDPAALALAPLLDRLVNYERSRPDQQLWDLATMRQLLARPGAPAGPRPAIQVGGSKGKGTTVGFLGALVAAAGRRAGLYTSPHLETLCERIQCNGQPIAIAALEPLLRAILDAPPGPRAPTFFEAMTAAAVAHFAQQRCDLAVYEVGLGGRLDATTAIPVDAGIVTMIELEHTELLGHTEALIAGEKAPVLRPGGLGYTAASGPALAVLRQHAARHDVRLAVFGEHFGLDGVRMRGDALEATLWWRSGRREPVLLPAAAQHELPALALAAAALADLLPELPLQLAPAVRPLLPCRFEVLQGLPGGPLILDGAHTEQSLGLVASELARRWPGQRATVLFGTALGKRWREGLSRLLPLADSFLVTAVSGTASEDPAQLATFLSAQGAAVQLVPDLDTGLAQLLAAPAPRLVTGSFYLAGAARALLRQRLPELR